MHASEGGESAADLRLRGSGPTRRGRLRTAAQAQMMPVSAVQPVPMQPQQQQAMPHLATAPPAEPAAEPESAPGSTSASDGEDAELQAAIRNSLADQDEAAKQL